MLKICSFPVWADGFYCTRCFGGQKKNAPKVTNLIFISNVYTFGILTIVIPLFILLALASQLDGYQHWKRLVNKSFLGLIDVIRFLKMKGKIMDRKNAFPPKICCGIWDTREQKQRTRIGERRIAQGSENTSGTGSLRLKTNRVSEEAARSPASIAKLLRAKTIQHQKDIIQLLSPFLIQASKSYMFYERLASLDRL